MPRLGAPTSQPVASSKLIWHVADAFSPILCSIEVHTSPLRGPRLPSGFGRNLGTKNIEIPLIPAGAPAIRASTRCTMFSVRSCSPAEMKIFDPVIRNDPSSAGTALVRIIPRSVPQCASVRHIVPDHSPLTILGK